MVKTLNFTATSGTNVSGGPLGPVNVAAGSTSSATSGFTFVGTTVGPSQSGGFTITDSGASNSPQTGNVSVNVYDHASPVFTPATLALGNVHAGYGSPINSNSFTVANGSSGDYRVNLKGSGTGTSNVALTTLSGLAADGSTAPLEASLATGTPGGTLLNQSITYTFADDSSLSGNNPSLSTPSLAVTGQVYSGLMIWSGSSGGSWNANANWNDSANALVHVAPGLDAGFTNTDTATLDATAGGGTVNLNGSSPSLAGLTFNNSTASYTLAGTGGGTLILSSGTGPALVSVTGTHSITAR